MRPRINKANTPSSVKVFSTFAKGEELQQLKNRVELFKEVDNLQKNRKPYVTIFGIKKYIGQWISMEEAKKANLTIQY